MIAFISTQKTVVTKNPLALAMGSFSLSGNNLVAYKNWKEKGCPIELKLVDSEDSLLNKNHLNSVLITDAGRTEFGKPTNTCLGEMKDIEIKERINLEKTQKEPAKQILIANRDLKLTKWELAPKASLVSWLSLEEKMIKTEDMWILKLDDPAMKSWLLGAFAKITLKIEEVNVEELLKNLEKNDISFYKLTEEKKLVVLATSPQFFSNIDPHTSHLKLY